MKLHQIEPPAGAVHKRKRVGRGNASGHGGTSTRGHKGHKARKGYSLSYNFEGGQMPLVRRLPKKGFTHIKNECRELLSLKRIEGLFAENDTVTPELLIKSGLVKKGKNIKILGEGTVNKQIEVHAHAFSARAKEKIEKSGGKAIIVDR
jgi:large subunit ribosomal protein L15